MASPAAASKRRYNIDPETARERGRRGALARNSPDGYISVLERATLTAAQKRRLAVLLMPFLGEEPGAGDGTR